MKKYFTIIAIVIICSYTNIFAQVTPYLLSEKLENARAEAEKVITNPIFRAAATFNGVVPGLDLGGTPVESIFYDTDDENKGKASGWIYVFSSDNDPTSIQPIFVLNIPFGEQAINLNDVGVPLDFLSDYANDKSLDAFSWINSDVMVDKLKSAPGYLSFSSNHPDPVSRYILLGFVDFPPLNSDNPYWFVQVHNQDDTDSTTIIIDAVTGQTTDVIDNNELINILVTPNPSQEFISVNLQNFDLNYFDDIEIFDLNGNLVLRTKKFDKIDITKLVNGNYYLVVNYKKAKFLKRFVVFK